MSLKPPFNKDIQDNFKLYQSVGYLHPFTCGNCSGVSLNINEMYLYCPSCDYKQTSIPVLPSKEEIEKLNPKHLFS